MSSPSYLVVLRSILRSGVNTFPNLGIFCRLAVRLKVRDELNEPDCNTPLKTPHSLLLEDRHMQSRNLLLRRDMLVNSRW